MRRKPKHFQDYCMKTHASYNELSIRVLKIRVRSLQWGCISLYYMDQGNPTNKALPCTLYSTILLLSCMTELAGNTIAVT